MSINLGLDRIRELCLYLPKYTRPTCHIAGTNGKGSVAALLSSILSAASPPLSVGRFNSPHLVSIYDCITIDGEDVTPDVYANARATIENADREHGTKLTNFELLTLTALLVFEHAMVDIAVIEVGMGGRLDATNVIPDDCVLVSALTAIDLDHQAFLGDTPEAIAKEKAGIARTGKPLVLGRQIYPEIETAVASVVDAINGELISAVRVALREWDEVVDGPQPPKFSLSAMDFVAPHAQLVVLHLPCFSAPIFTQLSLLGKHQLDNLGVACAIVSTLLSHGSCSHLHLVERISPDSVARGVKNVSWMGRLSFHTFAPRRMTGMPMKPLVVLADGAHNPASSATLSAYITHLLSLLSDSVYQNTTDMRSINIIYILALSHSPPKTPKQTLSPLFPPRLPEDSRLRINVSVAALEFTSPESMPWVKAVPPSDVLTAVHTLDPDAAMLASDSKHPASLLHALEWAMSLTERSIDAETLVVVAGSLYLVADFYRLLCSTS